MGTRPPAKSTTPITLSPWLLDEDRAWIARHLAAAERPPAPTDRTVLTCGHQIGGPAGIGPRDCDTCVAWIDAHPDRRQLRAAEVAAAEAKRVRSAAATLTPVPPGRYAASALSAAQVATPHQPKRSLVERLMEWGQPVWLLGAAVLLAAVVLGGIGTVLSLVAAGIAAVCGVSFTTGWVIMAILGLIAFVIPTPDHARMHLSTSRRSRRGRR